MAEETRLLTRRAMLASAAAPALALGAAPGAKVAIARCADYDATLVATLVAMMDQLGGLGGLVGGKTVTMKINLTGSPSQRMGVTPAEDAQYTHPAVVGALVHLCGRAGARRIRIVEGCFSTDEPMEEFVLQAGWDPSRWLRAAPAVLMENTNVRGGAKGYARFKTPGGGHLYPGFDLNHCYDECDVLVSVAKLKEHATCGVTGAIKNMFGATPLTIYGDNAGRDEPDESGARGGRGMVMHAGRRAPAKSAPQEHAAGRGQDDKWRIPRIVADLAAARPIHLSVIDGIRTMAGGEGPWIRGGVRAIRPGLLVAGLNPVSTDAVATALMGFDPMAERGEPPFERCDNHLALAEAAGAGTRDLKRIEIAGVPVARAVYRFRG